MATTLTTSYQHVASTKFTLPSGYTSTLYVYAKYSSQDIVNNTTTVQIQVRLANAYVWYANSPLYGYAGQSSSDYKSWSKTYTSGSKAPKGTITMATYEKTITHNTDGTKSINAWGKVTQKEWGVNASAQASVNLPSIQRYPQWTTQPSVTEVSETSLTIDAGITNIESNFIFSDISGTTKTVSGTKATYTGLAANTSYSITVTAANKNVTTLTSTASVSGQTWDWPKIVSVSTLALSPGNRQTINISNPHGRSVTLVSKCGSSSGTALLNTTTTNQSTYTFTPSESTLFNTTDGLGDSKTSINIYYALTYSGHTTTVSGATAVTSSAAYKPTWGSVTAAQAILYKDNNSTTTGISGNNQILVTEKSTLVCTKSTSYNATANKSSIASYEMAVSYNTTPGAYSTVTAGTYASFSNITIISASASTVYIFLRARDKRGYYSDPLIRLINTTIYKKPSGSIIVGRKGNFGTEGIITINPVWSINQTKNANQATIYYKLSSASTYTEAATVTTFGSSVTIKVKGTETPVNFDNEKTYNIKVVLKDKFGTNSSDIIGSFGPGTPILFIDSTTDGVGVNSFPSEKGLSVVGNTKITGNIALNGSLTMALVSNKQIRHTSGAASAYAKICDWVTTQTGKKLQGFVTLSSGYNATNAQLGQIMFSINTSNNTLNPTFGYFKMNAKRFNDIGNRAETTKFYLVQTSATQLTLWMQIPAYCTALTSLTYDKQDTVTVYGTTSPTEPLTQYTQIAYSAALDAYPVGSIYMSVNSTDPGTLFGGTWTRLKDRFLLGAGDTYAAATTGGESAHTLTKAEMPKHNHGEPRDINDETAETRKTLTGTVWNMAVQSSSQNLSFSGIFSQRAVSEGVGYASSSNTRNDGFYIDAEHVHAFEGEGSAHNNMPPYLAVYMWKRTA